MTQRKDQKLLKVTQLIRGGTKISLLEFLTIMLSEVLLSNFIKAVKHWLKNMHALMGQNTKYRKTVRVYSGTFHKVTISNKQGKDGLIDKFIE